MEGRKGEFIKVTLECGTSFGTIKKSEALKIMTGNNSFVLINKFTPVTVYSN